MSDYLHWHSFRELDEAGGYTKGTSFRAFKRIEHQLKESHDYILLRLQDQRKAIDTLRSAQRIYASSLNVVLLSPTAENAIREYLQASGTPGQ